MAGARTSLAHGPLTLIMYVSKADATIGSNDRTFADFELPAPLTGFSTSKCVKPTETSETCA